MCVPFCPDVAKYEKLTKVGQGTFGEVYKARDRESGKIVALKKVRMENEKEGFPMTALREIRILQLLNHENVINLVEYNRERGSIFLVFDFCEHDLAGLLCCEEVRFSLQEIKSIMQQLFNALFFIHGVRILNRDMKSSNILITRSGVLKLGDFGLARAMSKGQVQRYTNRVITLWYRPPELFLGERNYATPIDMWGAGCIMCEMWTRRPIMQGDSEQKQISLISNLCGSITPEVWPGVESLELYCKLQLPSDQKRRIRERLRHYVRDMHAIDLIDKLLVLDPKKRLDSDGALNHDFFWEDPMPSQSDLAHTLSKVRRSMFVMHTSTARPGGGAGVPGAGGGAVAGNTNHFHDRVF
ncbi:Cyclin-dependent kinase 9 [Geodia barretti]|uniref:Cyclin-dependent kinase 9 n=2 Tax=Geodia barretti TaxID=519541 RepID=A0AA35WT14_GEOBA|nr:Cyclin-dependent kinase 9 [Geodia barretti]